MKRDTESTPWTPDGAPGVERKWLARADAAAGFEVSLVRLAPGAALPPAPAGQGLEAFVLAGRWDLPAGPLEAHGYARIPSDGPGPNSSPAGCTLFVRTGPFTAGDDDAVHLASSEQPWLPGQGHLTVKPLHSSGVEGTALVHWPEGERFVPHRHFGGEEILVLSGTFEDEHGRYPTGTWLLSPHLSSHHPFVREETVILVKTGHLGTGAP